MSALPLNTFSSYHLSGVENNASAVVMMYYIISNIHHTESFHLCSLHRTIVIHVHSEAGWYYN